MRPQLRHIILFLLLFPPVIFFGQQSISNTGCPGVPGACGYTPSQVGNSNHSQINPNLNPQNGNGTLGNYWSMTKCGLNYTTASQRLGKRFSPAGINQPAPFVISGIPTTSCIVIEKAILYCDASGNGIGVTATVNGPLGTANYPMTVVGNGPDKCWGYGGTYTYRADVTASVNGNGTYNISGLPTNPPTSGNDVDGATLIVVWSDGGQSWQGTFRVDDGAYVVNGGIANYNMTYPAICGTPTNGSAFFCIGDIQFNPTSWTANSTACPLTWNWWNCVSTASPFAIGQTTSNFNVNTAGDCFNLCVTGIYFRTTCVACTTTALTLTTSSTASTCSSCNGTASVVVTSGTGPFTYSWNTVPVQTSSTATNLCPGT